MKSDIPVIESAAAQRGDEAAERLRFWRRSLSKHKWSALGLAAVVAMVTAVVVYSTTPIYRGTTTLLIESGKNKVVSIEEVYSGISPNREYFQTQVELVKSRELAQKLVDKLKLTTHPAFDPRQQAADTSHFALPWKSSAPNAPPTEEAIRNAAVGRVMTGLQVQLVRNSQLMRISYDTSDRELAAAIPNGLADAYIENDLDAKLQMTQRASAWLTERLGSLRQKLAASEQALQQYRERERIVDVKGAATTGIARQLDEAGTRLVNARQRRVEAENAFNQIQGASKSRSDLLSLPAVAKDPSVQKLKDQESELERKLAELGQRYGKEHPRIIAAEAELRQARDSTRRQVDVVVAGINREYEVAKANEQSLERVVSQSRGEIQSLNRKEFQLGVLEREVNANRELYDMFLNRFRQTKAAGDLQSTVARIVDPAVVPRYAVSPRKAQAIGLAAIVGLVLGIMLAFLLEYLDNTVKSSDDVEVKLRLPLLGILGRLKADKGAASGNLQRALLSDTHSVFAESVRTIRTSVLMSALDNPHKVILVTSSVPEEGKTTVATNLAIAFGQIRRVCLIDADMRRPSIAKALGLDSSLPGLSHLVAGTEVAAKCVHLDKDSGIHIIPAGVVPPNPQELLSSKRFNEMMKKLHEMFDIVIIDSPPVQLMSDSLVLSSYANTVIYVVKADSTPYQVARAGIERLNSVGAPVLGVVLNQLDLRRADRYYGYGKHSAYGKYSYYSKGSHYYGGYGPKAAKAT